MSLAIADCWTKPIGPNCKIPRSLLYIWMRFTVDSTVQRLDFRCRDSRVSTTQCNRWLSIWFASWCMVGIITTNCPTIRVFASKELLNSNWTIASNVANIALTTIIIALTVTHWYRCIYFSYRNNTWITYRNILQIYALYSKIYLSPKFSMMMARKFSQIISRLRNITFDTD